MAEARKRTKDSDAMRELNAWKNSHNKTHDHEWLLDRIETAAKQVMDRHPATVSTDNGGWYEPQVVTEARFAREKVKEAREGDMTAAMHAVLGYERMRWHDANVSAIMSWVKSEAPMNWRGYVFNVTGDQRRKLLRMFAEVDHVEADHIADELNLERPALRKLRHDVNRELAAVNIPYELIGDKHHVHIKSVT